MDDDIIEEDCGKVGNDKVIKRYTRGRLLGKGGFARCYEITCHETGKVMAAKIIEKSSLKKKRSKQKVIFHQNQ